MTEREHTTHERHDKESDDPYDSDYDEGDTVLACGWPRHHRNLPTHGFRPVWTSQNGYPEDEIPAEIQAWLDENGQRSEFFSFFLFFLYTKMKSSS